MGRHRKSADIITLPKLGPNGDLARAETQRVAAILERDANDAEREGRRLKHGYNDQPASHRNYEALDLDKTIGERRYRALPADHPLVKLFVKGKIPESEFNPGNIYRILFERANDPAGRDSTAAMMVSASRSSDGEPAFRADMAQCRDCLSNMHARMGTVDREIIRLLCGLGHSVAAAVDFAVVCAPSGRILRAREALRALGATIEKISLPEIAPELLHPRAG
jgi:hypothetical protein